MATIKSANPSGLAVKRDDQSFNCSWKIPSGGYGAGQVFKWRTSNLKDKKGKPTWVQASISPSATSKGIPILRANFYPTQYTVTKKDGTTEKKYKPAINAFQFIVKGTRQRDNKNVYTTSDFVGYTYKIDKPAKPTITREVKTWPSIKNTWKVDVKKDDNKYLSVVEYESILVKDCAITDGAKINNWSGAVKKDENGDPITDEQGNPVYVNPYYVPGSRYYKKWNYSNSSPTSTAAVTHKEDSALIADGHTYTRWVRVRSRGPAGNSDWAYARYIYAIPKQCTVFKDKSIVTPSNAISGYSVNLWYSSPFDPALHPMSSVKVQYALAIPEEGMTCPDGASWQEAATVLPTDKDKTVSTEIDQNGATFSIDSLLNFDQCLFCRVNSVYEDRTTYGEPVILDIGELKTPERLGISPSTDTHRITVHAENASSVPDSMIAVRYYDLTQPDGYDIGIIRRGETETIVQAPEWPEGKRPSVGVYAFVGDYEVEGSSYMLTSDTSIEPKDYFVRTGSGTENDPYVYTKDKETAESPRSDEVFEFYDNAYVYSGDESYVENKTYYKDGYTEKVGGLIWPYLISNSSGRYVLERFNSLSDFFYYMRDNGFYREGPPSGYDPDSKMGLAWFFIVDSNENIINAIDTNYTIFETGDPPLDDEYYYYRYTDYSGNHVTVPENEFLESLRLLKYVPEKDPESTLTYYKYTASNYFTVENKFVSPQSKGLYEIETPRYIIHAKMKSSINREGGEIPTAPYNVHAEPTDIPGTIRVTWDWSDTNAIQAELSWADHEDAWESTDEPSTYVISRLRNGAWNISGLSSGTIWYIRVRLISGTKDEPLYSDYSKTCVINLSSAPSVPELQITPSNGVITNTGEVTLSWSYSTTDGTNQSNASIYEVTVDEETGEYIYTEFTQVGTQQDYTISAQNPTNVEDITMAQSWAVGESHSFAVVVMSESGNISDGYSNIVTVTVAEPVEFEIDYDNLDGFDTVTIETEDPEGEPYTYEQYSLIKMPFTIAVTGVLPEYLMDVTVVRDDDYSVDRPDETDFYGFTGETIIQSDVQEGGESISFDISDLIGSLDDGAKYRVIITVQDSLGQYAVRELPFVVAWEHQPGMPSATVTIDEENAIAIMTPTIDPNDYSEGDVCDIYRLSVDKPVLIYSGAEFGTTYVDPYPTIGEYGGHRFVTRTKNGDYIMGDNPDGNFAWIDTREDQGDRFDTHSNIIDFAGGRAFVLYEVSLSNSWAKDFKETKYLGGHIQGDWNKAVSRTGSISVTAVSDYDQETIQTMRRLAEFPGVCHIRSKDGSSYFADVQVSETYEYTRAPRLNKYDLTITRVDPEELEGMTLEEWNNTHREDSEG